ncbi:Ribonuclease H-like domain protein [Kalmanozyma brasiliensis GHG001]|uniref:Uncharacterized protein n=1 Tax=Kalmanozyma brasiliensis (strain GHG001) TaxID=1365824 RepID=V5E725_KALBG|nr:Ribonuclease H-like domain protein [Kalmanozyma brasiliensis GHG001]EST06046.1 Ribonuclease H-like domain protein [Kalmanozyma brasiliensis GHG001]
MPTATKRADNAPPKSKRRPSATGRSESGYSRRSSIGSFKTATGASEHTPGNFASEDDEDDDDDEIASEGEDTMTRSKNGRRSVLSNGADETDTKRAAAVRDDEDSDSSNESDDEPAIFNTKPSSETSTAPKSPPTSHEDAASQDASKKNRRSALPSKSSRRDLLVADSALSPERRGGKSVRNSYASHLTLPYQRSDAGDGRDASNRLSKLTLTGYNARSDSRAASLIGGDSPVKGGRDARKRSESERGGSRASRLLPAASMNDLGRSGRSSFQSTRDHAMRDHESRYARSLMEPRSPSKRELLSPGGAGIYSRDSDRFSITSRGTARRPASVVSKMLDAENQVYAGTRIRKYIEPQLNEAMRRVMKQFAGHNLQDHRCNGYPIAVFVGATAIDTGSIIQPHVSGAVSLYFGPGHPKNMASVLPDEDRFPSHIPNPKAPTPTSLSRRAELRSAVTALHTIYELYQGRACAHVCIDSAYVAKAWGAWIPTWEAKGWPGEDDEREGDYDRWEEEYSQRRRGQRRAYDKSGGRYMDLPDDRRRGEGYRSDGSRNRDSRVSRSRSSFDDRRDWLSSDPYDGGRRRSGAPTSSGRRGGDYSSEEEDSPRRSSSRNRGMRRAPGQRLVDEDLLRELADIRYEFARVERDRKGSAHFYLIDRSNNPADRMARAVAKAEGNPLKNADQFDSRSELGLHVDEARLSDDEVLDDEYDEWLETRSRMSGTSRASRRGADRNNSRNSNRGSIVSSASGKLRNATSMPAGNLRGARRQLDTFAEEDEDDLAADAKSVRSARTSKSGRSGRSKKSTRAERERDDYRARQEQLDAKEEVAARRSTMRGGRLAPPSASERGGGSGRLSLDSRRDRMSFDLPDDAPRRGSLDTRRKVYKAKSQPEIRENPGTQSVRNALASAAVLPEDEEEDYVPRRSLQISDSYSRGPRHPRSRLMSSNSDYPEMDDLVPPTRGWDGGSVYSRQSVDGRRRQVPESPRSTRKAGRARDIPEESASPQKPKFGLFSNRSTPSLRAPAPEDADYNWKPKSKKKKQQREWQSTTARDYADGEKSGWDEDQAQAKKGGFFSRMFGRKK